MTRAHTHDFLVQICVDALWWCFLFMGAFLSGVCERAFFKAHMTLYICMCLPCFSDSRFKGSRGWVHTLSLVILWRWTGVVRSCRENVLIVLGTQVHRMRLSYG